MLVYQRVRPRHFSPRHPVTVASVRSVAPNRGMLSAVLARPAVLSAELTDACGMQKDVKRPGG